MKIFGFEITKRNIIKPKVQQRKRSHHTPVMVAKPAMEFYKATENIPTGVPIAIDWKEKYYDLERKFLKHKYQQKWQRRKKRKAQKQQLKKILSGTGDSNG